MTTDAPAPVAAPTTPSSSARDAADPRLQGRRARALCGKPHDRRPLPAGVHRASAPTCPTTPRRAPCAAGTSPAPTASRGPGPPPRTAPSSRRDELEAIYQQREGPLPRRRRDRLLPHRRALAATPGSCSPPARLRDRSATTTGPGPSGATPSGCRSPRGAEPGEVAAPVTPARDDRHDDPTAGLPPPLAEIVEDFQALGRARPAAAAAGVQPGPAAAAARSFAEHPELMEPVRRSASRPIFLTVEVDDGDARRTCTSRRRPRRRPPAVSPASCRRVWTGCPRRRCSPCPVTCVPGSAWTRPSARCGMRGMAGMLARIKRQVRVATVA